jgi:hypothetical protein
LERDEAITELVIDNSLLKWIEPVGLVCLLAIVRRLRYGIEERCPIRFASPSQLRYLQRMDLLRQLGVEAQEGFRRHSSVGHFVELRTIENGREVNAAANDIVRILPDHNSLRALAH